MDCNLCQKRLLSAEKPEFPDLEVTAHLAQCRACRAFQHQLANIEANVARVPVPPSEAKARLLREILGQPAPAPLPIPRILRAAPPGDSSTRPLRHWLRYAPWTGVAAAAAVVLIVCGIWFVSRLSNTVPNSPETPRDQAQIPEPKPKTPRQQDPFAKQNGKTKKDDKKAAALPPVLVADAKPLVSRLMECDLKLAEAETVRERVEALAELADLLQHETRLLSKSAPPTDLNKLASLYKQVIEGGVVPRARDLPMDQRKEVLHSLAVQLAKTTSDTELQLKTAPQSADALRTIALAARDGDAQLRQLMQEAGE